MPGAQSLLLCCDWLTQILTLRITLKDHTNVFILLNSYVHFLTTLLFRASIVFILLLLLLSFFSTLKVFVQILNTNSHNDGCASVCVND